MFVVGDSILSFGSGPSKLHDGGMEHSMSVSQGTGLLGP